jgi:hypothetical protein
VGFHVRTVFKLSDDPTIASRCRSEQPVSNGVKILPEMLTYFVVFGAMIVLFSSVIGIAFWMLKEAWRIATRPD